MAKDSDDIPRWSDGTPVFMDRDDLPRIGRPAAPVPALELDVKEQRRNDMTKLLLALAVFVLAVVIVFLVIEIVDLHMMLQRAIDDPHPLVDRVPNK